MTLKRVLSYFRGFTAQKKIKRAILPDFSTFFHFFHTQKTKKYMKISYTHFGIIFFGVKNPRKRHRKHNSVEKKNVFSIRFFFGKSYIREIIDFIAFSDVFWLSKHDPAIILSKITDLDSFRCCFRSFHERPKKSQKIGGW